MNRTFDTDVQLLKYKVLKAVSKRAFDGTLQDSYYEIPKEIIPGKQATMRCCVYKERAILGERVHMAMGGNPDNPNVIEVIDIACDECPVHRISVSESCRGCLAHRCQNACPRGAISFVDRRATIDHTKCVSCGRCAQVCPYGAIQEQVRPCERSCKVGAIAMNQDQTAEINNDKCISCGSCVYQCPFGAIVDKSFILDAIQILKESDQNQKYKVYAVIAPAISSQFSYAKIGQVVTGIKKLGFHGVVEAALGADMTSYAESAELAEKGFLTSSCCPAFVTYVEKFFPKMAEHISHNLSPMAQISKYIKETDPTGKVIFIGPCTAKKMEVKKETVAPYVDCVLTFEELQALLDSQDIAPENLEESLLDNASYYGRIFARSGGLSAAVEEALKEQNIDFTVKPEICDGIEQCKVAILKAGRGLLQANFIEGMACIGGCIGGAACLTHGPKDKSEVDKYGKLAFEKGILDALTATKFRKEQK